MNFTRYELDCYQRDRLIDPPCQKALSSEGMAMLDLAADLEAILRTNKHFLLGRWISAARSWGATSDERDWLEWNARDQVTLWGSYWAPGAGTISNYAAKQWSGLVGTYYLPRWRHFITQSLLGANPVVLRNELREMAENWVNSTQLSFPSDPSGDATIAASYVLDKWFESEAASLVVT